MSNRDSFVFLQQRALNIFRQWIFKPTSLMLLCLLFFFGLAFPVSAQADVNLTVTPLTWNIIGLDSNSPLTGPYRFPVGARVCNIGASDAGNVTADFTWDSVNAGIYLRPGSLSSIAIGSLLSGSCYDAYFEVEVDKTAAPYDTTRRYYITATDAVSGETGETPQPRELYVEHLISQNRNSVTNIELDGTSIPPGGSMTLLVGNTYNITLYGGTATQGYEEFEAFINFSNTIFQILSVSTTYSADSSGYVSNPNDKLYGDACLWDNDPNSPNYRSCVGVDPLTGKVGGNNVVTTYTVRIIGGGGTSETLNSLLYDFSGSSYHYNGDYGVGARIANIVDPTNVSIAKSFSPNPTNVNGVSALTITLTNPNPGTISGFNFTDNFPANMTVANPPGATTSGCGTPTFAPVAGAGSILFSNGTLAANSSCLIKVNVTASAVATYTNTTNNLFVGTLDTGKTASADLAVNADPPPGTGLCNLTMAQWTFDGFTVNPPPFPAANTQASDVATAAISLGGTDPGSLTAEADTTGNPQPSMMTYGWPKLGPITPATSPYTQFAIDTSKYTQVNMQFDAQRKANGPTDDYLYYSTDGSTWNLHSSFNSTTSWATYGPPYDFTGLTSTTGVTYFRIYGYGANATSRGNDINFDNVTFTGCGTPAQPTISKSFSPDPVAVNGTSTLTFTLTNTNTTQLTGAKFTDTLPAGLQVAATPLASTTCTGAPSWGPLAGDTTLNFGQTTGADTPASGSCTASVNITATTSGPHNNVSGFLSTIEGGTNKDSLASASLTAVLPPFISKQFAPDPILANSTSTLTFTITNPNQNNVLSGVAFTDTFPTSPGNMVVANPTNATTSGCGVPTFAPVAGAGSVSFSNGTIAGGGTCTVTVNVTAPVTGDYNNTSGNVSHIINAATVNGNTASDSLTVNPPNPAIAILKQVSTTASGPWLSFLPVLTDGDIYYKFTIENIGDVPLNPVSVSDPTLSGTSADPAACVWVLPLPVASPTQDPTETCVKGPVTAASGLHPNTATSHGTYGGTVYNATPSTAAYATAGLTIAKSAAEPLFTDAGDLLHYSYVVTNSGLADLIGPVTVADDKSTDETCPAVSTVGDFDNFFDTGESITCTATYTVTAGDVAAGFVTNTASASAGGFTSNTDSETVFSSGADLSIIKTSSDMSPAVSDSIIFTVTVTNNGPSDQSGVEVKDTLPSGLTYVSDDTGGDYNPATGVWTIGSLAVGSSSTINITVTVNQPGQIINIASITGYDIYDPDLSNNSSGLILNTGANETDLAVDKTVDDPTPSVGENIVYAITVTNNGPDNATGVQLTDIVPAGLSYISDDSGGSYNSVTGIWSIGNLNVDASVTLHITAQVTAGGQITNTAAITASDQTDPDITNNESSETINQNEPLADLAVQKTVNLTSVDLNGTVVFTVVVRNNGPDDAHNVQIGDVATAGLTNITTSGCGEDPNGVPTCSLGTITAGSYALFEITAEVTDTPLQTNTATVTASDETDPNPNNNEDDASVQATAADLSVTKTDSPDPVTAGQNLTYTVTVNNAGISDAANVVVTDTLPAGVTFVSTSGCAESPGGGVPACSLGTITAGNSKQYTITVTVNAGTTGILTNSVNATSDTPDPDNTNNTDTEDTAVNTSADLSVTKTDSPDPVTAGQTLTYTLSVTNSGPSTASNITVTDTLPAGVTYISASGTGWSCGEAGGTVTCTRGSLAAGSAPDITIAVTAPANGGSITNSASVTSDTPDPVPGNNSDSEDTAVNAPNLFDPPSGYKTVIDGRYPILEWRMVWINSGNAAAINVRITDAIPAGTTYEAGSISCDARGTSTTTLCIYDAANNRIIWEGNIGPDPDAENEFQANNEVVITFRTNMPPNVFQAENQGCANWDEDGDGSVDDEIAAGQSPVCTDDPATGAPNDPTKWQFEPPTAVPTLNEWGMLIFMILAGLCSVYYLRRLKNI